MKRFQYFITLLLLIVGVAINAEAQNAVLVGDQVTSEDNIISGKAYLVQYVGNASAYVKDANLGFYDVNTSNTPTEATIYYFIQNEDNTTWKIKSFYTGKYWGSISGTSNLVPATEDAAGDWTLNFSGNQMYPKNGENWLSRSNGKLHGWASNSNSNFKIYEIAYSSTALTELAGYDMEVATTAAASLEVGLWYAMKNQTKDTSYGGRGWLYEKNDEHTLYNTSTAPGSGMATEKAKYLVRLINAGDGKYYIQTGYGNYFGAFSDNAAATTNTGVPVTAYKDEKVTISKIASTDGHFYLQSSTTNVVLNARSLSEGDAWVVGYGTTVPTSIEGNNDWGFYPVSFSTKHAFTADNVAVIQGNQTTGKGNSMQALLRVKVTPFANYIPTAFNITLTGADQLDKVAVYTTTIDEIQAEGANPQKIGEVSATGSMITIPLTGSTHSANTSLYYWITADIKADATEWESVDAAITNITYTKDTYNSTCDLSSIGNPNGEMRIYKQQAYLWTSSVSNTKYYRIPTILNTADGGIIALTDYRHDHPYDLGKNASNGFGSHVIDVVARKYNGSVWSTSQPIATGDGTNEASWGYGDPAIVADADGTLHCLMASGKSSYASASGMLHMGYTKSTDNGVTWTSPTDIYGNIDKAGLTITSAFTTGGKGVTFDNGRMAFAFLGKVNGTTNIYPLYSDDKGATWKLSSTVAYGGGDESKFEIMNDNSLLVSVRRGNWNTMANRGYNRTKGDASGIGINTWGTQSNWGNEMNANGCNADILYYSRATEDASRPDVIFHTLTKTFSTYRKDLRLYMSFDEGETWKEAFQLQPGYAAYSSMQKLANGDLAIIFEDGSIGNMDKQDCYAINYVVISKEMIEAKINELHEAAHHSIANIIDMGVTDSSAPYGTWSPTSGWANKFTTNTTSGMAGIEISATYNAFNRQGGYDQRVFCIKPSAAGAQNDVITITAPGGFVIDSYSIGGYYGTESETYTLTAENGSSVAINKKKADQNPPSYLEVTGINKKETTITMSNNNSKNSNFAYITHFTVTISSTSDITLHEINGSSYATLYLPYAVTLGDDVKAYTVTVDKEKDLALLTELGQTLPAYTPVVLQSATGKTSSIAAYNSNVGNVTVGENALKGILHEQFVNGYVLNAKNDIPGFYKLGSDGTLAANRAYLPANVVTSEVKGFAFAMDDETGIETMHNSQCTIHNDVVYDLTGRRIMNNSLKKGLYIIKGKKVLIR